MSSIKALDFCKNIQIYKDLVSSLKPKIGALGGRRFYIPNPTNQPSKSGDVCLNELVSKLNIIYFNSKDSLTNEEFAIQAIAKLKELDQQANELHRNSFILKRILTAIKQWFGNFGFDRLKILTEVENSAEKRSQLYPKASQPTEPEIDPVVEQQRLQIQKLSQLTFKEIMLQTSISGDLQKQTDAENLAARALLAKLNNPWRPTDQNELTEAFSALKNDSTKFDFLAQSVAIYWSKPLLYVCQFLENLDWPSQKQKKEFFSAELVVEMLQSLGVIIQQKGYVELSQTRYFTPHQFLIDMRKIIGRVDYSNNKSPLPSYICEGIAFMLKDIGHQLLETFKKDRESGADLEKKQIGMEIKISQFVECRFSAALISPLLPLLQKVPGLVAIDIQDIGTDGFIDNGNNNGGFGDQDAEALLDILRTNPCLQSVKFNTNSMTPATQQTFIEEWQKIADQNRNQLTQADGIHLLEYNRGQGA